MYVCLCPENPEKVLAAVRPFGEAWIVQCDRGTQIETVTDAKRMMDANLIILAGGVSSRMKKTRDAYNIEPQLLHDAEYKPKAMIGVGEGSRPFLDYLLFNAREAGYRDVVIVIGEHDDAVKKYYGQSSDNNHFHGLTISYAVQSIPSGRVKPLGNR